MKLLLTIFLTFCVMAMVGGASAEGGKNRALNPVIDDTGCVTMVPAGLDLDQCVAVPAPDQSSIAYFCDNLPTTVVVCGEEDPEDTGDDEDDELSGGGSTGAGKRS